MIEVALVAFADTWDWDCSLVLTDPTVGTVQRHTLWKELLENALNFQVLAHILKILVSQNVRTQSSVGHSCCGCF